MDPNHPNTPTPLQSVLISRYNELEKLLKMQLGITTTGHHELLGALHLAFGQIRSALITAAQSAGEIERSKLREQSLWRDLSAQRKKIKVLEEELARLKGGKPL